MRAIVAIAWLFATATAWASTADELRAIEEARRAAIRARDFDTLSRIYAPEFVAVAGNGEIVDRARLFAVFRSTDPALTFTTDDIEVLDLGDSAVFIGRLTARTAGGQTVAVSRFSHTFVRTGGQWRCVYGQSTPMPVR